MKSHRGIVSFLLALCALGAWASTSHAAAIIATSKGLGADAEVRDSNLLNNFGASTELATRILDNLPLGDASDGNDRFSAMYMRFDIQGQVAPTLSTSVRLTYRNNNLTGNRLQDTTPPGNNTAFRTGVAFYGLDRDHPDNMWVEGNKNNAAGVGAEITYLNAPGMGTTTNVLTSFPGGDGNNGTKDFDFRDPDGAGPLRAPMTALGVVLFPLIGTQNHLPVGGELLFSNTALDTFVKASIAAGKPTVTIVASVVHDGKIPVNDWKNFNYIFNPKEMLTTGNDATYDPDGSGGPILPGNPPTANQSNAADANGFSPYSPQLILKDVPEPTGLALAGLALATLGAARRRR